MYACTLLLYPNMNSHYIAGADQLSSVFFGGAMVGS